MIIIKGNLIMRQARNINRDKLGILTETSSDENNDIVAYADLSAFNIADATVLVGDIIATELNDSVVVTGEVCHE